jgi:hypothetical protein
MSSKSHLTFSNNIFKWPELHSNRFLWTSKTNSRAEDKFYYFSVALEYYLSIFEEHIGCTVVALASVWWVRMDATKFVDISPINIISPICFRLYRLGNGNADISSAKHFVNSKISRTLYFCPLDLNSILCFNSFNGYYLCYSSLQLFSS